ncbi:transcriptional regulator, IclR family domain protein [Mycobacterium xenopi 4042]|uniref:Transcriptional regulator, IclR family domain protein n=1 Tax=Mycobacterium xenopi 4042 TaxID=1299334 RepID=X7Z5K7_MYCXE|nr:transcriptional regulator, IclR family domain protein [Mycobacterium xenopi 4042]
MHLEAGGKPVRGGPGQAGAFAQFSQAARRFRDRVQHTHSFVEHPDAAILSHKEILASRIVRTREVWD